MNTLLQQQNQIMQQDFHHITATPNLQLTDEKNLELEVLKSILESDKAPTIYVIVPIYNIENYIRLCIKSILQQTFQDFEIILVNDASSDNSLRICMELFGKNNKISILNSNKNLGPGLIRNAGLEKARGKYIMFIDSDDAILPYALERLYNAAEKIMLKLFTL